VYRFKENLMWMYDENESYYGSVTNAYLTYDNTPTTCQLLPPGMKANSSAVSRDELSALRTALAIGQVLNRIVILPRFHCGPKYTEYPLSFLLNTVDFDSTFQDRYQESTFLLHPKVPASIKSSRSPPISVCADAIFGNNETDVYHVAVISESMVVGMLGRRIERVLMLTSLRGVRFEFSAVTGNRSEMFDGMISRGFTPLIWW